MRRLFLSSSFADVASIFRDCVSKEGNGKSVTFISTASIPEKVTFYVEAGRKAFAKLGISVDDLDISKATHEEIAHKLEKNDYIYISGGNTFFLLQELKRTGADRLILDQINFGKQYIGESAGSMVVSPNIEYAKELDDSNKAPELQGYDALDVVDFYPLPHYTNFPFKKTVERIINRYERTLKLCPISNTQAIVLEDDNLKILSKK